MPSWRILADHFFFVFSHETPEYMLDGVLSTGASGLRPRSTYAASTAAAASASSAKYPMHLEKGTGGGGEVNR